jgi:hypothetical protein
MSITMERPVWRNVATSEPVGATAPIAPPAGAIGDTVAEVRMIDWRASDMEPGVYLSNRWADHDGRIRLLDPVKVIAVSEWIDPADGEKYVQLTFDNGWSLPFAPDDMCEVQCVDLPHPAWCVRDDYDKHDGTVRHCGGEAEMSFTDETGKTHEVYVVLSRWDDPDGTIAEETSVSLVADSSTGFDMTPAAARELGQMITDAGAACDTEPNLVDVASIRLGDEVETPDGWQEVTCLLHDAKCAEVAIYTIHDDEDALRLPLGTLVNRRTQEVAR